MTGLLKLKKNYLAQVIVVCVAVHKRPYLLAHLVLNFPWAKMCPNGLLLFIKLVVKLQEVAVIPRQTPYQAPRKTKMNREAQSSPVSRG